MADKSPGEAKPQTVKGECQGRDAQGRCVWALSELFPFSLPAR